MPRVTAGACAASRVWCSSNRGVRLAVAPRSVMNRERFMSGLGLIKPAGCCWFSAGPSPFSLRRAFACLQAFRKRRFHPPGDLCSFPPSHPPVGTFLKVDRRLPLQRARRILIIFPQHTMRTPVRHSRRCPFGPQWRYPPQSGLCSAFSAVDGGSATLRRDFIPSRRLPQ